MFCYYSTYAQNRPDAGQFLPEDIDADLCTHVIIAFGDIIQGTQLKASGWNDLPNGKDAGIGHVWPRIYKAYIIAGPRWLLVAALKRSSACANWNGLYFLGK
jgi:hypothetical protein